jgi:hypothetical protein
MASQSAQAEKPAEPVKAAVAEAVRRPAASATDRRGPPIIALLAPGVRPGHGDRRRHWI